MTRQHGLQCVAVVSLVGFLAVTAVGIGSVSADTLSLNASEPKLVERLKSRPRPDALRLSEPVITTSENPSGNRQLLLVARRSCLTAMQNTRSASTPLVSKSSGNGDWILLAGLSSSSPAEPVKAGPILRAKSDGSAPADWYYTLEMYIVPSSRWSIRASLGFDSGDILDALIVPAQKLDPLHIGVAIAYDYGARNPLVLDLDYGRLPLEGHGAANRPGSETPVHTQADDSPPDAWVVSACLNIQF